MSEKERQAAVANTLEMFARVHPEGAALIRKELEIWHRRSMAQAKTIESLTKASDAGGDVTYNPNCTVCGAPKTQDSMNNATINYVCSVDSRHEVIFGFTKETMLHADGDERQGPPLDPPAKVIERCLEAANDRNLTHPNIARILFDAAETVQLLHAGQTLHLYRAEEDGRIHFGNEQGRDIAMDSETWEAFGEPNQIVVRDDSDYETFVKAANER